MAPCTHPGTGRQVHKARLPRTCCGPCAFDAKKTKKKRNPSRQVRKHFTKYISSPATAITSRRRARKHPLGSPYSHSSSIDVGFVEIGLAQLLLRRLCTLWCSVLFSGERSFDFFCCDTRIYGRYRGCPVVLDIELSVSEWYHKTRRELLHARRLPLLLLTAEGKQQRLAVCGITFKPASNGAEAK